MIRRNPKQKSPKKREGDKKLADIKTKRSMVDLRKEPAPKVKAKRKTDSKPETATRARQSPEIEARILIEREVKTLQQIEGKKLLIMWSSIGFIMISLVTVWIFQFKNIVKSSIPPGSQDGASSSLDMVEDSLGELKESLSALEKINESMGDFKAAVDSAASSSAFTASSSQQAYPQAASSTQLEQKSEKLMDEFEARLNSLEPSSPTSSPVQTATSVPAL